MCFYQDVWTWPVHCCTRARASVYILTCHTVAILFLGTSDVKYIQSDLKYNVFDVTEWFIDNIWCICVRVCARARARVYLLWYLEIIWLERASKQKVTVSCISNRCCCVCSNCRGQLVNDRFVMPHCFPTRKIVRNSRLKLSHVVSAKCVFNETQRRRSI